METTLREALDNADRARAWNKEIRAGRAYYAESPLNGMLAEVTEFRTRKGHLQAKSARTGRWLSVTPDAVHASCVAGA